MVGVLCRLSDVWICSISGGRLLFCLSGLVGIDDGWFEVDLI